MEIKTATEQKSLLDHPGAGQADPPAPPAVRVRSRPRDPAVPADRPGDRARSARLLPEPGVEGPRVPVPPRRRGRLLGDRLPDRPGDQVLPRLRRPGAAAPEGQRQDRHPAVRRRALDHERVGRGRRPAGRRRGRLHALRRLAAPGRRPAPAPGRARGLRPLRHAAGHLGLPARQRYVEKKGGQKSLYAIDYGARLAMEMGADVVKLNLPKPGPASGLARAVQRARGHAGGGRPPRGQLRRPLARRALRRLEDRRRPPARADPLHHGVRAARA